MPRRITSFVSIYTLSGLGVLSNLNGSLSRTIQYSPPNKWIICEVGVFPVFFFLENDLSKGLKILGLMFFKANGMSPVGEAVLWTQRFLARKILPKNRSLFMRNETKCKCLQKFYVSSKQDKEYYLKRRLTLSNRVAMSAVRSCEGNDWNLWTVPLENCHVCRPFQILLGNFLATFRILSNFFSREQLQATFRKTSTL